MPPADRFEFLDAVRGAACLAVVAFHAVTYEYGPPPADQSAAGALLLDLCRLGWMGVPVFFAVSGYCVAAAAQRHRERGAPASDFARRRFWRIAPPFWAALAFCAAVQGGLPDGQFPGPAPGVGEVMVRPGSLTAAQWLGNATLSEDYRPAGGGRRWLSGHFWTLAYEAQFYAVVGLILTVRPALLWPALAAVTVAVYARLAGLDLFPPWPGFFWNGLWLPFAAGATVYAADRFGTPLLRAVLGATLALAAAGAARGATRDEFFGQTVTTVLTAALAASALMLMARPWDAALGRAQALAPLRWAGRRCYSLYLVHPPLAVALAWQAHSAGVRGAAGTLGVTLPLILAAALPAAELFYRAVERPCSRRASGR